MADYSVHLSQAQHNEQLANKLIQEPPYHDWAITAAFYASIHYIECWLFEQKEKHTETSIPVGDDGKFQYTPHAWREKIVERKLNKNAFKSFRKLRESSETARYLSLYRISSGITPKWLDKPASNYFSPKDASDIVNRDLAILRQEVFKA
jgi:hypothetical protein